MRGMATSPPLHPALTGVAFLLGTWHGRGEGHYPTIAPFAYEEDVEFWHAGKPFLGYLQRTRGADGTPLHSETGYWRAPGDGRIELVLSHSFGLSEIGEGKVDGTTIDVDSTALTRTPSAKLIEQVRRRMSVSGDTLTYDLWMDAVGVGLHHHLHATLTRSRPAGS